MSATAARASLSSPGQLRARIASRSALALLVLLSCWGIAYELSDTLIPSWVSAAPFYDWHTDVPFFVAGLLVCARGFSRPRSWGWVLIGAGSLCWATGDVYWNLNLASLSSPPVPSWADAGYLMFCPLTFAGIVSLVRNRLRGAPRTLIADAAAAALCAGAFSAAVVVRTVLAHAHGGSLAIATNLAYPIVDLLLLGLIVGVVALGNWRLDRLWLLLGAGALAFWVADSFYLITVANNTYQQTAWFNPLWNLSPILFGWAAWVRRPPARRTATDAFGARGIVIPLGFACAALGLLVWSSFHSVGVPAIVLCAASLLVVIVRLALTWRENARLLMTSRSEALTDSLTGLANRRALGVELERRTADPGEHDRCALALFDLDGFKLYNDCFGHLAGDALLQRLGANLAARLAGSGSAYRMGGDEFCILLDERDCASGFLEFAADAVDAAADALTEHGEGFAIGCSYGFVLLPDEADGPSEALRVADQRMYAHKHSRRPSASRQSGDVLLRALVERDPELGNHVQDVAVFATATATGLGLSAFECEEVRQAAELHDIGKVAIPDAILEKPGRLTEEEWAFIRRHTLIGERILAAAPALRRVAALVRSSHESFDGKGYPDGLAGSEIPLGSRIIAVCDAFHAMTSDRPYRKAMSKDEAIAELRGCAGRQFDPGVVEQFCSALERSMEPLPVS
jgi:diguanylate cyclase (GGDEF)-like protein